MQRSEYDTYIDAFNRADYDGFLKYYTEDVLFELGNLRRFEGRQAILDFYREVKSRVRETVTVHKFISDEGGVAAEIEVSFLALEDYPEFIAGPLKKGDVFSRLGLIMYDLQEDGLISYIRSARTKITASPW